MKVYIKTYGCQMNERDSEALAGALSRRGYLLTSEEGDADILIFNTCSVREQAERKAIGKLGILKRLKKVRPDIFIGIMGCMAQKRGEELLQSIPHLDFAVGTEQLGKIPDLIDDLVRKRRRGLLLDESHEELTGVEDHLLEANPVSAYISITRGCNRFCSYCIVPYVRGREKSRKQEDIVAEAAGLVAAGVKEIMLLGQNVAAFGMDGDLRPPPPGLSPFAELLEALNQVEGLRRIRFTSPYPSYFNDRLIEAIASLPKVCHGIHLPLQSGSDRILKLMNRQYGAEQYLDIVRKLKALIPDVSFSTDIIVGFPGESDEDFAATRKVMAEVGFDNAYIFKYSPREGTPAALMDGQLPQEVKEDRNQILLADLAAGTASANAAYEGKTLEVLAEGVSKRNGERWSGRTSNNKNVIFDPVNDLRPGDLLSVEITHTTAVSLFGQIKDKIA